MDAEIVEQVIRDVLEAHEVQFPMDSVIRLATGRLLDLVRARGVDRCPYRTAPEDYDRGAVGEH